jgi:TolA-binding protein
VKPEQEENKIIQEIECLTKMKATYEKEIEMLNTKMKVKSGSERVMELERKIIQNKQKQDEMMKKIREYQKSIKDTEKVFEKDNGARENGTDHNEVLALINF